MAEHARADHERNDEPNDELDTVRRKLAARIASAFDRLDDAVSELYALHAVAPSEIRAAVEATLASEARSATAEQ